MTHAARMHQTSILQRPDPRGSRLGLGISLLIHTLAVVWLWHAWRPHRAETDAGPVRRIQVRLIPVPAMRLSAPAPNATLPRSSPMQTRAAPRRTPPGSQARASAPPMPTATAPEPPAEIASGTGTDAPAVDLAAARAAARLIARENGKVLVTLPSRKPVVDANADHHVVDPLERARRVDCQTARAESTNLLANVVMLAVDVAKNAVDNSGCKW